MPRRNGRSRNLRAMAGGGSGWRPKGALSQEAFYMAKPRQLAGTRPGAGIVPNTSSSFRDSAEPQQSSLRRSARPPDLSLGLFLDLPTGLSLDSVRLRLLPLWPWRDHTPECDGSAAPRSPTTILTRTPADQLTDHLWARFFECPGQTDIGRPKRLSRRT